MGFMICAKGQILLGGHQIEEYEMDRRCVMYGSD